MYNSSSLTIGKSYINNLTQIACAVIGLGKDYVRYKTHLLITGERFGPTRECTKNEFLQWADREATPEEMVRLQHNHQELYPTPEVIVKSAPDHSLEEGLFLNHVNWTIL